MENEYISEELDEWQHISSPFSIDDDKAHWINENNTPIIKENFFNTHPSVVFPPNNHQDLPITSSISSSTSSSLAEDEDKAEIESADEVIKSDEVIGKWRRMILGAWRFRLLKAAIEMKNSGVCRIRFWSSILATSGLVSMVVVSLWCLRMQRWRKRVQMEKIQHLMLIIKEREQKINQLLLQISHLNEMLLTRRSVPVLRIS